MSTERIQQLQQFYEDDPGDPFNLYALALEYLKHDEKKSALFFEKLLHDHKEYLPTYYHAAKFFQERSQKEKAAEIFEAGIQLSKKNNDSKALRELKSAYDEMMFE
jgi:hypothetical protein